MHDFLKSWDGNDQNNEVRLDAVGTGTLSEAKVNGAFTAVAVLEGFHATDAAAMLADGMILA